MKRSAYEDLFKRYQSGEATPAEQAIVEDYILNHKFTPTALSAEELEAVKAQLAKRIKNIPFAERPVVPMYRKWKNITAAAAAVAAIVFGVWFYNAHLPIINPNAPIVVQNDIAPGKNTATLTLANGKTITLSDAKTGVVVNANDMKYNDGTVVDKQLSPSGRDAAGREGREIELLTATTPRGGTYQFTLPDGTQVWLNAASTLKFPSQFSGQNRKILLSGEAYFEVAKNKAKPFIVESNGQEVTVLGTHFNINAYNDERNIKTTLLEGSVKVSTMLLSPSGGTEPFASSTRQKDNKNSELNAAGRGGSITLTPNQQAINTGNKLKVKEVDPNEEIAWKNGDFIFTNQSLADIMKSIARWYDVQISYDQDVDLNQTFSVLVSRNKRISQILLSLENTGQLKFKITGKNVRVSK